MLKFNCSWSASISDQLLPIIQKDKVHLSNFIFSFFKNLSIVNLQCCANLCCIAKWIQLYAYMHSFFMLLSIVVYHRILNIVPCAICIRILLCIHSKCNSLHSPTQNSQSVYPHPCLDNHKSVLYVCEYFSFVANLFVPFFILHICVISYGIYFFLSDIT